MPQLSCRLPGALLCFHAVAAVGSALNSWCTLLLLVCLQESVKARHPQLLYESKLYKILQGGGEYPWKLLGLQGSDVLAFTLAAVVEHLS
jgi:hypothetical protein